MAEKQDQEIKKTKQSKGGPSVYVKVGLTVFLTFACCILLYFFLYRFSSFRTAISTLLSAAEPILIGLVLAYLLNPVMRLCERFLRRIVLAKMKNESRKKKLARGLGITASILFLLIILTVVIAAIVPALIDSIRSIADTLPGYVDAFLARWDRIDVGSERLNGWIEQGLATVLQWFEDFSESLIPMLQTYMTQITTGMIAVVTVVINFLIGIVAAVYTMSAQERLIAQVKKICYALIKPRWANIAMDVTREADKMFGGFIRGKLLDSLIMFCICYPACLIMRIPNPLLIAATLGVTNIIPVFGPFIGGIPCVLLVLVQSPIHALYLAVFIVVIQQVDGNIIGPRILGSSTGLSSFWVLAAILIFGGVFGFFGMILGVPTVATLQYIVRRLLAHRLKKRSLPPETDAYVTAASVDPDTEKIVPFVEKEKKKRQKEAKTNR